MVYTCEICIKNKNKKNNESARLIDLRGKGEHNTFRVLSYYFISDGATKNVLEVMNVRNINPSSVPRFYYLLGI